MLDFIKPIEQFIESLSKKELQRYILIYLGSCLAITFGLLYWHYQRVGSLEKRIQAANKQRIETRNILSLEKEVKHQKDIVNQALKQRQGNFRLLHFFEDLINKLQLQNNLKRHTVQVEKLTSPHAKGYSEVIVEASLISLNTRQLVGLLDEIEKNTIIYTKYLETTKSGKVPAIDVIIKIATLELDKEEANS